MKNDYTVYDVAEWFLHKESMSPKKLQKLCYYAYAWGLVFFNESKENLGNKLYKERLEAWVHGPVSPDLYRKYAEYGYSNIEKNNDLECEFEPDVINLLEQVYEVYGNYDGNELESITHQEVPWINARKGYGPLDRCTEKLNDQEIFTCYGERVS